MEDSAVLKGRRCESMRATVKKANAGGLMINGLSFDVGNGVLRAGNMTLHMASQHGRDADVERGVERLLWLLHERGFSATFFVMGSFAEKRAALVRRIAAEGHEIASHGYCFEPVSWRTRYSFHNDAVRSKRVLEDIAGKPVLGYRVPGFALSSDALWAIGILGELGFKYDSSIFPHSVPARYRHRAGINGFFTYENGMREFPLTAYRFLRMGLVPSGGIYFRLLPALFSRLLLQLINRKGREFVYCLHSLELASGIGGDARRRLRRGERRFRRLLSDFEFQPLGAFLAADGEGVPPSARIEALSGI